MVSLRARTSSLGFSYNKNYPTVSTFTICPDLAAFLGQLEKIIKWRPLDDLNESWCHSEDPPSSEVWKATLLAPIYQSQCSWSNLSTEIEYSKLKFRHTQTLPKLKRQTIKFETFSMLFMGHLLQFDRYEIKE